MVVVKILMKGVIMMTMKMTIMAVVKMLTKGVIMVTMKMTTMVMVSVSILMLRYWHIPFISQQESMRQSMTMFE